MPATAMPTYCRTPPEKNPLRCGFTFRRRYGLSSPMLGSTRPTSAPDAAAAARMASSAERAALPVLVSEAADAVELLVGEGLLAAQQKHHAPRA